MTTENKCNSVFSVLLKISFSFFLTFLFSFQISAQSISQDTSDYPYWIDMMQDPDANFYATQSAFEKYWENRTIEKGGGWKPFKRWESFMENRINPDGSRIKPDAVYNAILEKKKNQTLAEVVTNSNWTEVGPIQLPTNGTGQPNGLGRVNAIGFHPTNADIIYLGTPAGGVWKTTDGGNSWSSNTDALPTLGVSAIIVNPDRPETLYMGSGDRDGGDSPGLGVFKSYDEGTTWVQMNNGMGNRTVGKMLFSPVDTNTVFAATSGGIYKTTNGGANWTLEQSGNFKDIRFKPTSSTVMYATASGDFYRSTDAGESWTQLGSGQGIPGATRMVIGVSEANPNYVYVVATASRVFTALYQSTDSGQTFTTQSTTPNIMDYSATGSGSSGQAWYDLCIAVDPVDIDVMYVGGVNVFKSSDGGVNWTINAHWVGSGGADDIHADQHVMEFSPIDGKLYNGNDGGFYTATSSGTNWTDKSSGLAIAQIYKIGQSATVRDLVINGYQDNGTAIYDGGWRTEIGGDGMECIVDHSDSDYIYGALYYGDIRRSTNNGFSFSSVAGEGTNGITESGAWVTPYILHETDANTMFVGMNNLWRSTNIKASSPSFTKITNLSTGSTTRVIEHSQANTNLLYFARTDQYFNRIDNVMAGSPTVVNLSANLPNNSRPTDIEAHPTDENIVYITQSSKVYKSEDKGSTWTDITGASTIPNVPINCIVYALDTPDGLYVGTDAGIYYRESGDPDWIDFSMGFPLNSEVTELEIFYDATNGANSRIRAATYGRGLWESQLENFGSGTTVAKFSADPTITCLNSEVTFTDLSTWNPTSHSWTFTPNTITYVNGTSSTSANPIVEFNATGSYTVSLTASNALGGSTETKAHYIYIIENISSPNEDFESGVFPPVNWSVVNPDGNTTWEEFSVTGSDGSTTLAARINNFSYNANLQEDEFISLPINASSLSSMDFDLSYAPYSATYNDSFRVDIFIDCGLQYHSTVYGASYLDLATTAATTSQFVPNAANEWRNEVIDLSSFTGDIVVKFININGYGNNLYIDNINFTGASFVDYYPDMDGDNFGDENASAVQIPQGETPPANHVLDNTDCDDDNEDAFPGNIEVCDGDDNNCDGLIDEGFDIDSDQIADCLDNCPEISNSGQEDIDGDGFGDACDCDRNNPNDVNINVNSNPIPSGTYVANNSITSNGTVNQSTIVEFKSGVVIDLTSSGPNGFIAKEGSNFIAKIEDCGASAPFTILDETELEIIDEKNKNTEEDQTKMSSENVAVKIYPNPFENRTSIFVQVEKAERVDLGIYNSTGNLLLKILDQEYLEPGKYQFEIDGQSWGEGMYHTVLRAGDETKVAKIIIVR